MCVFVRCVRTCVHAFVHQFVLVCYECVCVCNIFSPSNLILSFKKQNCVAWLWSYLGLTTMQLDMQVCGILKHGRATIPV